MNEFKFVYEPSCDDKIDSIGSLLVMSTANSTIDSCDILNAKCLKQIV